jgi:RNA recognition motif-containing protein
MNTSRLYVGGLPYSTTEDELEELFGAHGSIESVRIITDRMTGRSKGFGFVEMSTTEEAEVAVEKLNNTDLEGRTLIVNEARPREKREGGGGGRGGGGYGGGGGGGRGGGGGGRGGSTRW